MSLLSVALSLHSFQWSCTASTIKQDNSTAQHIFRCKPFFQVIHSYINLFSHLATIMAATNEWVLDVEGHMTLQFIFLLVAWCHPLSKQSFICAKVKKWRKSINISNQRDELNLMIKRHDTENGKMCFESLDKIFFHLDKDFLATYASHLT